MAAYLFTYAEFVLPICLVLGFATRLSALALLILTVLMQIYVAPQALWTTHVYWIAILMVLMSVGPGAISLDRLIRHRLPKIADATVGVGLCGAAVSGLPEFRHQPRLGFRE